MTVSILSERRALPPFGLNGGHSGARGINLLIRKQGVVNLGSKSTVTVEAGDRLRLLTPGIESEMRSRTPCQGVQSDVMCRRIRISCFLGKMIPLRLPDCKRLNAGIRLPDLTYTA